ncbi:hypothetical protein [Streptomyces sp. NPDC006463]|uniref:hypothetical protein n=1 Tax=Streptomyces sp. NPDC006463 TaxID=3364746 RepID=UPI0036959C3A
MTVLDWESWGMAPVGYDAACLWTAPLPVPALASRVLAVFADVLGTQAGRLARLMLCANVERVHRRTGKTSPLTVLARTAATDLLESLT